MVAISENPSYRLSSVPVKEPLASTSSQSCDFPTYRETVDVSPRARIFCEILNTASLEEVESLLSSSGIKALPEVVEEVLRLLYGSPSAAVKFFRWAELSQKHSASVWNLMIDLLGRNNLFEQMWDAIRSMKQVRMLSVDTFVLVFRSYCSAGRCGEALRAFDVMERYGVQQNVRVVNSLLSEICRGDGHSLKAFEFFEQIKTKIPPDIDSYVILMEALEKEKNVEKARVTFEEMVTRVGWSPENVSIYDAFLITLFHGSQINEAIEFLQVLKGKNCFPGLRFFSTAIDILNKQNDIVHISFLWDVMVKSGVLPNLTMFNSIIGLFCNNKEVDSAFRFLDEMVFYGAFPDSVTYNMIFKCLVKTKKVREAGRFFIEMTKNECPPTHLNCAAAIAMFFSAYDPETAVEIWHYMLKNRVLPFEESANMLLIGLCNLDRLTELKRFAEKMLDRNIHISEATMAKIKQSFHKRGGSACDTYDDLARKWKLSQMP